MKVLLVCGAGMSTSILMKKMEKYAADNGIELQVEAHGFDVASEYAPDYECILVGPQIGYHKDDLAEQTGLPTAVIPPADYGMGNCANIIKLAQSLIG
jgi:cellobiose PTS system EIIB component